MSSTRRFLWPLVSAVLLACGADTIVAIISNGGDQTISARVGQEIDVTLGNVGPAEYADPPTLSSAVVTYLGVDIVPPYNPGGPNQRFRFRAENAGTEIIDFRRMLDTQLLSVVEDTIQVR